MSGYSQDAIWLFSVEMFNKELEKFNLKIKAEVAEQKQAVEQEEARRKALQKSKK